MAIPEVLARVIRFLRLGYPDGVPHTDYIPLFALLRRRLSDEEILMVAREVIAHGNTPVADADIEVAITKATDALPSAEETERVRHRLRVAGWSPNDPFESSD
ncbi:DUF3349 domain-containing protein [Mycobacteroides franklinii]|uniref:DUF3349 domain-containing protein n=1 Tax=Mycobacteroides franklinii TaxID=948102 RepID=A0A4R5P5Q1_9MYCO|nr:DUF3349 domain-containing protein [Mycobacteroides franklinii]ORA59564.1 hypothetical protein BST24_17300 [Mycobacteroides franklinii]TDH18628.1 DUF3349 domain-containing protein [Mycobacteroides franklinii]TDZ46250.1 hypothetical protein CCUG64054_00064 [Mycobacteroides franklinii]TDZ47759.1 hypothetical protein CCUG63697_04048 [Mycobacteroides franklinii]TDZ59967.1 hypothetical protein CCUG63696_00066 [Mycobacteroides franklinii]